MKFKAAAAAVLAFVLIFTPLSAFAQDGQDLVILGGGTDNPITSTPVIVKGTVFAGGSINIKNDSGGEISVTSFELITSIDPGVYPFEVEMLNYTFTPDNAPVVVAAGEAFDINIIPLTARTDCAAGYYDLSVKINYTNTADSTEDSCTVKLAVKITEPATPPVVPDALVPKVIISGYSTSPSTVVAGENFTLKVTFTNKGATRVSSLKASVNADGTFTPISGTSTMFIDSLAPSESSTSSIKMQARADAAPGSYSVSFSLNYDAPGANDNQPVTDSETLSIPVIQIPKLTVDKLTVSPETVYLNGEINITTKVNNTGKSTLYNVSAAFKDANGIFSEGTVYVGNVVSGTSGAIDVYLSALAEGEATVAMVVTYENESGEVFSYSDTYTTFVTQKNVPIVEPVEPDVPQKSGLPIFIIVGIALVFGLTALLIVLKNRKKKKLREKEKNEALLLEEALIKDNTGDEEVLQ